MISCLLGLAVTVTSAPLALAFSPSSIVTNPQQLTTHCVPQQHGRRRQRRHVPLLYQKDTVQSNGDAAKEDKVASFDSTLSDATLQQMTQDLLSKNGEAASLVATTLEYLEEGGQATNGKEDSALQRSTTAAAASFVNDSMSLEFPVSNNALEPKVPANDSDLAQPDPLDSDTVNAILAVSKEAVEAAESSFSDNVASQLGTFGSKGSSSPPFNQSEASSVTEILPASLVVGDAAAVEKVEAPSFGKILKFAIPATGVWLCSPLLSLIDTSAVGLLSGTVQQAALNPAVAVTEYSALLIAFLYTATTNLIAASREKDRGVEGSPLTTKKMIGSMRLSTYVGAGMGLVLLGFAPQLVKLLLGQGSNYNPAVFEAAVRYVRIRAFGMPAAAMIGTAQAACLGMQDAKSPLYVLIAAAVVNLFGDMMFVGSKNPWIGGAAGAAWATTFSQYAAVAFFLRWLCFKPKPKGKATAVNISTSIMDMMDKTPNTSSGTKTESVAPKKLSKMVNSVKSVFRRPSSRLSADKSSKKSFSARGFLQDKVRKRSLVSLPSREITKEFSPYVVPVTLTQLGRVSSFLAMSHVISSSMGTMAMAAQQVIISFFYTFAPVADSLSLTAQSLVPSISEKSPSKQRAVALRQTMMNLAKVCVLSSLLLSGAMATIPILSRFSTTDANVISLIRSVIPYLVGVSTVHAFVTGFEGVLLGRKDLNYVGKMYGTWFVLVPYFMLKVKKAALAGSPVGIASVWKVFLFYNLTRFTAWMGRCVFLQRKTEQEAELLQ